MSTIPVGDLLQCLAECCHKAGRLAQVFRADPDLLVEEKSPLHVKGAIVRDYKTLADVLVQETIRADVGRKFPSLLSNVKGEEQNSFKNSLGQTICVELTSSEAETTDLLEKVLEGNDRLAKSLAAVVHSNAATCKRQLSTRSSIPADSIGIWIDPIDSTAEYIQAKPDDSSQHSFQPHGLKCVCVLIGVYELETGRPVIGVVNQPFFHENTISSSWDYQAYWAVNYKSESFISPSLRPSSSPRDDQTKKTIVVSFSESQQLQDILAQKYQVVYTAGAGYKALLVAQGKADMFVLSQPTTHFWDTCGPHSLLAAQGGGMVKFADLGEMDNEENLLDKQIVYSGGGDENPQFRNLGGLVAYTKPEDVLELIQLLKDSGYLKIK